MGFLVKSLWLGCRVGAVGYFAYSLDQEGVFSHKTDADVTVANLKAKVPAEVTEICNQIPSVEGVQLPKLPSVFPLRETWNWGVMETGHHLGRLPQYCYCASNYLKETVQSMF